MQKRGQVAAYILKYHQSRPEDSLSDVAKALYPKVRGFNSLESFSSYVRKVVAKWRRASRASAVSLHRRGVWKLPGPVAAKLYAQLNLPEKRGWKIIGSKERDPCQVRVSRNGYVSAYVWKPELEAWREWAIGKLVEAGWPKEFADNTVWGLQCLSEASHLVGFLEDSSASARAAC